MEGKIQKNNKASQTIRLKQFKNKNKNTQSTH